MKASMRRTLAVSVALVAGLVFVPTASNAAKPAPTATVPPTIQINQTAPALGDTVNFTVTYPREVKSPRVAVRCTAYDNAGSQYAEAGPYDASFTLGGASSDWQRAGGAADCTADLFYFVWKPNKPQEYHWLASTEFEAGE